jgi:hypothetical protein
MSKTYLKSDHFNGGGSGEQAARELQADLRWLPFEIHPDTPPEGAPKPFSLEEWPLRVGVVQSGSAISG